MVTHIEPRWFAGASSRADHTSRKEWESIRNELRKDLDEPDDEEEEDLYGKIVDGKATTHDLAKLLLGRKAMPMDQEDRSSWWTKLIDDALQVGVSRI